ncbi:ABC transporter permease [uncultured Paludibaculum sp.]|uniref:ABC transporter permease n=1 Tax=uncultured Paludibaculum sp. TaxID=1765020 RepID=UPI002AAC49FF|nr:ABC transporter permease [uncultured Paludibaculum sp.]
MTLLETLMRDMRFAFRMLRRSPGSTVVTVLVLAAGIAVSTVVFTGYKAMVARLLDARAPEEMVNLALKRDSSAPQYSFSYPDYEAFRESLRCFSGLIAYRPAQLVYSAVSGAHKQHAPGAGGAWGQLGVLRRGIGSAETATVFVVSENYFRVLGVGMLQGRSFESMAPAELANTPPVLLSENYWRRHFGGDAAVIGRTVYLNGAAFTITGITPHNFVGTSIGAPAFWLPASAEPLVHGDTQWLRNREEQPYRLFGRLAPGGTTAGAQAEVNAVAEHLRSLHDPRSAWAKPGTAIVWRGSPFPLPLAEYGGLMLATALVLAAAGMVVVVASANVGSLQLARSRARVSEMRTRMSLGASRSRLIGQMLTESALIGVMAGGLALVFTQVMLRQAAAMMVDAVPGEYGGLVFDVPLDFEIFAFVSTVSLLSGMLSGLAPALEGSRFGLSLSCRGGTASVRSRRLQDALVVAQVTLSLVLVAAANVAIRSSVRSVSIDTGYNDRHVLALAVRFPETLKYSDPQKRILIEQLRARLAAMPGVAAVTSARPPVDAGYRTSASTLDAASTQSIVHYTRVEPNYFDTLAIPFRRGGRFPPQGSGGVVLSESAAEALWPGQNPVGRSLRPGPIDDRHHNSNELVARGSAYTVLGVVRDTRAAEFHATDSQRIYIPLPANEIRNYPILVRTRSDPAQMVRAIDALLTSVDPNLMADCSTLAEMQRQSAPFVVAALTALVASAIGLVALLLALLGIWSTVSYIVVLRTREVGVRMAMGAQRTDVLRLILNESARPILRGLLAGSLLAAGASYPARGLLYGMNGIDWAALAVDSMAFLIIGLLACYPPAWRATRVDPQVALRHE